MHFTLMLFFFFFQAEDGIRDLTVTGVQTCALPISTFDSGDTTTLNGDGTFARTVSFADPNGAPWTGTVDYGDGTGPQTLSIDPTRSEERRVGKECRSRWSPYH